MAYTKTNWQNGVTPINDTNLNNIETGIDDLLKALGLDTDTWVSGQSYNVGDIVIKDHLIYECITANSDSTFNAAKWSIVPILI